ncbi:MAG: methyltransferase domain-containing protein [Deltaproteobacteria bacterium]|nr:MAG: methyltransferase domain-containing protein [Deltaproteobacteria bacterium]
MSENGSGLLANSIGLFQCPRCSGDLRLAEATFDCLGCDQAFAIRDGIPMLFWPNEWDPARKDVTDVVKSFYEETPFPNYDDFDSVASLARKAREGIFARMLDQQVPPGTRILECGCGTGQLSNFLSISNRSVFATDLCVNSLRLGQQFAREHQLSRVQFVQMNLFRPVFKPGSFHLVISNGVLHHTSDPFEAFRSISTLVKPGGFILIGLYHRYGRLITDARRLLFRLTRDRFTWLDPNLADADRSDAKRRAWFADQYKHPHESKHTIGETLGWLKEIGFSFVSSIPRSKPFRPVAESDDLFSPEEPGNALERLLVELPMVFRGSREGGFFIVIARRP